MSRSYSAIHVKRTRKPRYFLRITAFVLSIAALLLIILAVLSFQTANKISQRPTKPLANFSANVMPDYQNISFRSLDETITLKGWFFPAKGSPAGTLVVVHSFDQNRLPFDADTAKLYERVVEEGFHIIAFDLRNSGESTGDRQTFGYREWEDVLAAMEYSYQLSSVDRFVLYGIGTGVTAALKANEKIPFSDEQRENLEKGSLIDQRLAALSFDPAAVKGFIFDTALTHGDDYISYLVEREDDSLAPLLKETVPLAVRMSSGLADNLFIIGQLSRMNAPVMLVTQSDIDFLPNEVINPVILERERLYPAGTWQFASKSRVFLGAYDLDDAAYRSSLIDYLRENFD